MRIDGIWLVCEDGIVRPIIRGQVRNVTGLWLDVPFLLDSGADCTVFNADTLALLDLPRQPAADQLGGVGGRAPSVRIDAELQLLGNQGRRAVIKGLFPAFTDPEALDISVLGRNVADLFAVIIDRPADSIALLKAPHQYQIVEA